MFGFGLFTRVFRLFSIPKLFEYFALAARLFIGLEEFLAFECQLSLLFYKLVPIPLNSKLLVDSVLQMSRSHPAGELVPAALLLRVPVLFRIEDL